MPEKNDKLKQAENDLEDVKEIAKTSIDKMVERGIQLDDLVDKTSKLKYQVKNTIIYLFIFYFKSNKFQYNTKKLRQKIWWEKAKWYVYTALIFFIILAILYAWIK